MLNNMMDFLFTTAFGIFILISYAFPLVCIALLIIATLFKEIRSLKEIKIKEFKESVKEGAVNKPHMLRNLELDIFVFFPRYLLF